MLGLAHFTPPGRLTRGGPDFSPLPIGQSRAGASFEILRHFLSRPLSLLVCALGASFFAFLAPIFAAQSSSSPASSQPVAKKKKNISSKPRRQLAPEPDRIKEIQQALARESFYQGDPTGKWDDATVSAMKNFQQAKGLQPTGKIEALSLQKLGLGSSVAGLAPPTPRSPAPPHSDPPEKP